MKTLPRLLQNIRQCRICEEHLPQEPNPVVRVQSTARLLITSQAPSTQVHRTGLPFNDASGDRLRDWLGLNREQFYDETKIAFMPMGFCYPGRDCKGGDLPPRKECAPLWHSQLLAFLPNVEWVLLVGRYAQLYYLGKSVKNTTTETVFCWQEYGPRFTPLPHPSWRNTAWLQKNPWFQKDILPFLKTRIHHLFKA